MHTTPMITVAACQPSASASVGSTAPATAPPTGTPVWRIDMTRLRIRAGVRSASMTELAGVDGPYPPPISTAPMSAVHA